MNTAQKIISADFDIDNLDGLVGKTHKVGVRFNDDGDPISGFLIVGKNSPEYLAAENQIRAEGVQRGAKRKEQIDSTTIEGASTVVDIMNKNDRTKALAVTVGWFGWNKGGVTLEFDKSILVQMLDKMPTWQDAILGDLDKEGNFI